MVDQGPTINSALDTVPMEAAAKLMPPYTFVDTMDAVPVMLRQIEEAREQLDATKINPHTPLLYIDVEGCDLCRHGTVSLIQIHIPTIQMTFILDVFVLGADVFTASIDPSITLKSILESPEIIKCFFDVRNDSDALYNIYHISMTSVVDLQILENATRRGSKRLLNGLSRTIRTDAGLAKDVLAKWVEVKQSGKEIFDPPADPVSTENGVKSEVANIAPSDAVREKIFKAFEIRPLPQALIEYCINDVIHLPRLWLIYDRKLDYNWRAKTENESVWRLHLAIQDTYYGHSGNMALGPF